MIGERAREIEKMDKLEQLEANIKTHTNERPSSPSSSSTSTSSKPTESLTSSSLDSAPIGSVSNPDDGPSDRHELESPSSSTTQTQTPSHSRSQSQIRHQYSKSRSKLSMDIPSSIIMSIRDGDGDDTSDRGEEYDTVDVFGDGHLSDSGASVQSSTSNLTSTSSLSSVNSALSAFNKVTLATLLRNTRIEYTNTEADLYLMTSQSRFYDMIITKKQRVKFMQLQSQQDRKRANAKLPGQIGPKSERSQKRVYYWREKCHRSSTLKAMANFAPSLIILFVFLHFHRDWLVNFCWSVLKRRSEYDAIADCYQQVS